MFCRIAARPASWSSNSGAGWAPTATRATATYIPVTTISAMMIASGMLRRGFLTSSPAVDTASRPMNEKKMTPAAVITPLKPPGANGVKFAEFQPVTPITMNSTSTASLMTTMVALTFADSLVPLISSSAHSATSTTAGRLRMPPDSGEFEIASGSCTPNTLPSSWLRYSDQPTATAAAETPYSRSRHAATPIATTSPSVA